MTSSNHCKNCGHPKESHKLIVDYPDGPKVYPETITPFAPIESKIVCTQCNCKEYFPIKDSEKI